MFKLIVIDDDQYFINSLKRHIRFEDFNLELIGSANNGNQGKELINLLEPDIVISDIDMPQMSGIDMLKEISGSYTVPLVILLTGLDSFECAKEAVSFHAFAYLTKPVFPPEIYKVLQSAVSKLTAKSLYSEHNLSLAISQRNKQSFLECCTELQNNICNSQVLETSDIQRTVFMMIKAFADTFISDSSCSKNLSDLKEELYTLSTKESIAQFLPKALNLLSDHLTTSRVNASLKTLEKIKHYIEENYSDPKLSVKYLSERFNISANYLRILFKDQYHMSLKDYLSAARLDKAEKLILSEDYKIYEIAEMVGYSNNISQFRAEYKRHFGHLPSFR